MTHAWHFLQSELWARHKESFGWTPVVVDDDASTLLTLTRRLPLGLLLTYVPYAPAACDGSAVPGPDAASLGRLIERLVPGIRSAVGSRAGSDPAIIRFDLPQSGDPAGLVGGYRAARSGEGAAAGGRSGGGRLKPAPVEVQPPSTVDRKSVV